MGNYYNDYTFAKEDIVFYNVFTAGHRYLMLGYLYAGGEYGLIKFFDYLNMPITYIICLKS